MENEKTIQDTDFQWFIENYDSLFQKYGESHLAIKNKTVLGVFSSYGEAVREIQKKEPLGTFIVQYCNGKQSAYTNSIASMFTVLTPIGNINYAR